ncbi:SH3 domain-containing protein [Chloroflexus sp.]
MADEQGQRPTGSVQRDQSRQGGSSRTERLQATSTTSKWRPSQQSGTTTINSANIWQTLPRWLQQRGWIYLLILVVLLALFFVIVLWLLRGDQRNAPLGTQLPTAITLPTADAGSLPGNEANTTAQPAPTPAPRFFVVVNTGNQGLFLRPQPNRNDPPITTLPEGTRLEQIGEDVPGSDYVWRPVRTPDGLEGYVAVDFLAPEP